MLSPALPRLIGFVSLLLFERVDSPSSVWDSDGGYSNMIDAVCDYYNEMEMIEDESFEDKNEDEEENDVFNNADDNNMQISIGKQGFINEDKQGLEDYQNYKYFSGIIQTTILMLS